MVPTLPAASQTANLMLLAPEASVVAQLTAVPLTEPVMLVQVVPPSTEPHSSSALAPPEAAANAPLSVAVRSEERGVGKEWRVLGPPSGERESQMHGVGGG